MECNNYIWSTEFDTANRIMTHTFSERVKVITNFTTTTITLIKDGAQLSKHEFAEDYSLLDYEKYLLTIARSAHELKSLES